MSTSTNRPRGRQLAFAASATVLAASAAVAGSAGVAQAAGPSWSIENGQSVAVSTYFFGKTVICVENKPENGNYSSFRATLLSTAVSASLAPGENNCNALNRSWFGAYVRVYNQGNVGPLTVSKPFGP